MFFKKMMALFGALCFSMCLYACGGTEVIKNPEPIVWGEIKFAPETIEKSSAKTVWNNVNFSGYNKNGVIQKVIITDDEVVIENINSNFYKAASLKLGKVIGDYQNALAAIMSGKYEQAARDASFAQLPDVKIGSYIGGNEEFITSKGTVTSTSSNYKDVTFRGVGKGESEKIAILSRGDPEIRIEKFSCGKIFVPEDARDNPEGLILDSLHFFGISVPDINASINQINLNYGDRKFDAALKGIKVPSDSLRELNIQNFPEFLEGDLQAEGSLSGQKINLEASLDLDKLLDLSCDLVGTVSNDMPDSLNFTLADKGFLKLLTQEQKAQLAFLALFVPDGAEIAGQFLSRPGQTLKGNITFRNGTPQFNFKVQ